MSNTFTTFSWIWYYTNINCFKFVWRLKYILEVKDWIVPFHGLVGEWNGQFIFHRVDIFQHSHEFKTVNICFISLLYKFIIYVNFTMTCTSKFYLNFIFRRDVYLGLELLHDESASPSPRASMRCVQTFNSFCTIKRRR